MTFLTYLPSLRFQFVYDDWQLIVGNPLVHSWRYVGTLLRTHMWAFGGATFRPNYWRPLFMVWLLGNYSLFGLRRAGWHLTAVLLHIAVALLVYALARRLMRDRLLAAAAALIFALHPATIEETSWVLGATESFVALFVLGALMLYIDGGEPYSRWKRAVAVALYACGLLAKETAVALVPLVLLYAGLQAAPGKRASGALRAIAPYLAVTAVYLPVRLMVLKSLAPPQNAASWAQMVFTWPLLLWRYLELLAVPTGMALYYDVPLASRFSVGRVGLPLLGLAARAAGGWWWSRRRWQAPPAHDGKLTRGQRVAFAAALLLVPLVPVMYLRALIAGEFLHVRYLHLSCAGFALLLVAAVEELDFGGRRVFGRPAAQAGALGAVVVLLTALNVPQQAYWVNDLALYARAAQQAPHSLRALTNLGSALNERGQYEAAIAVLDRGLAENPDSWHAHFNLGFAYAAMGQWRDAEEHLERAVALDGVNGEQYAYLSVADRNLGKLERAEWAARQALEREPRALRYHYSLGLILEQEGKREEAAREFEAELQLNPSDADARARLGRTR